MIAVKKKKKKKTDKFTVKLTFFKASGMAKAGPIPMTSGGTPTTA